MNETIRAIAELIGSVAWPGTAVFVAVYYRHQIIDLTKRLRKGGGAEFDPVPQPTAAPTNLLSPNSVAVSVAISKTTSEALESFPRTNATLALERMVLESPFLKGVGAPDEREKVLVRMLARAFLVNGFEQAEASIWASQLDLLAYLNSKRQGESLSQIKALFYDKAAVQYPQWYQNYSFDQWIAFLQRNRLLIIDGGNAAITDEGIEYLSWRVQQARSPKLNG